jgi:hypothetical protein
LFSTYATANSQKYIDLLITTTKELEKYKSSIRYKTILLPVMQNKKNDKKITKTVENTKQPQRPKAKIFEK